VPALEGKEHSLLTRFLSVYEGDTWRDAHLDWLEERFDGAVELLATRRSDRTTLAIEHTVIQPYDQEKSDYARFKRAFQRRPHDRTLDLPECILSVDVPAGLLQPRTDWSAIAEAVFRCIRAKSVTLQDGPSVLTCDLGDGTAMRLQAHLVRVPGAEGSTIVRRYGPFDVTGTVRTALAKKLPKLTATSANRRLLMLERDQWHLSHEDIGLAIEEHRPAFPQLQSVDEVWIAETHENRNLVLFAPVKPDRAYAPVFAFSGNNLICRHDANSTD
jgi:hypothetical protein